ncbi:MAG: hypothetical protein KGJ90_02695, partial [Patescibacteria group bacterium]|nr:hypothetical protein [Patescibacteria group bacterium]
MAKEKEPKTAEEPQTSSLSSEPATEEDKWLSELEADTDPNALVPPRTELRYGYNKRFFFIDEFVNMIPTLGDLKSKYKVPGTYQRTFVYKSKQGKTERRAKVDHIVYDTYSNPNTVPNFDL